MSAFDRFTPEQRVDLIVSGNFTPNALGPGYKSVLDRVRADPARHMAVFERKFLGTGAQRDALVDLNLAHFLRLIRPQLPGKVKQVAQKLAGAARGVAKEQIAEFETVESVADQDDLVRRRRLLTSRNASFTALLA